MPEIRCAVSGASGYVGSCISAYLRGRGCFVKELGRRAGCIPFSLEAEFDPRLLEGFDAIIHCAYDFKPRSYGENRKVNVEGSIRLLRAAKKAGVKRIIFISSMSSFPGCKSDYGRAKLEIEAEARKLGAFIIRPGLVYGKGAKSVFGKMRRLVDIFPILPRIDSGKLYLCHNEDLGNLAWRISTGEVGNPGVPMTAASEKGFRLVQMLGVMAAARRKRVVFIPAPTAILFFGLRCAEKLGLSMGIRSDSMVGLLNVDPSPDFKAIKKTGCSFREFSERTIDQ